MTREEFGRRLKAAREERGLTQREAAAILGVAQPRIAERERGERLPPFHRLVDEVAALGIDPAILAPEWFGG